MSAARLSPDNSRRRPRRPACPGKLLVALSRSGPVFSATCIGDHVLRETAKDAVMEVAAIAWSRIKKDTVRTDQISAKEIKHGLFETRCFRGCVPAIEPAAPLLRKTSVGGRHAR